MFRNRERLARVIVLIVVGSMILAFALSFIPSE